MMAEGSPADCQLAEELQHFLTGCTATASGDRLTLPTKNNLCHFAYSTNTTWSLVGEMSLNQHLTSCYSKSC